MGNRGFQNQSIFRFYRFHINRKQLHILKQLTMNHSGLCNLLRPVKEIDRTR